MKLLFDDLIWGNGGNRNSDVVTEATGFISTMDVTTSNWRHPLGWGVGKCKFKWEEWQNIQFKESVCIKREQRSAASGRRKETDVLWS